MSDVTLNSVIKYWYPASSTARAQEYKHDSEEVLFPFVSDRDFTAVWLEYCKKRDFAKDCVDIIQHMTAEHETLISTITKLEAQLASKS